VGPRTGLDNVNKSRFLTLPGLEPQPADSRYIDCAILAPSLGAENLTKIINLNYNKIGLD
jgi:hypothetical protein